MLVSGLCDDFQFVKMALFMAARSGHKVLYSTLHADMRKSGEVKCKSGRRRDPAVRAAGYEPVATVCDVKVAIVPPRDVKVAIVRGSAEPRGLTLKDATRGGLGEREEDNDRRQCAVNSVSEQRQAACVIQRSIEPSGNPPSPLHHVNHARARLLRQATPLRAFAIHRRNYSTCPASGSNTTDWIRCADTVRHLTTSGLVPLTGGKCQDSWWTREYGDVVNLCPAPTKRDNDCESLLTQRSSLTRKPPS